MSIMRQRKMVFRPSGFVIALLMVVVLAIGLIGTVHAAKPEESGNIQLVAYGVQMDKDGNLVGLGWARGNSDKGWVEGAWQPVILRIPNAQTEYGVNLVDLPDFYIGFDFYNQAGKRQGVYCDMVRSIQIGVTDLDDGSHEDWGWPQLDHTPYPTNTMPEVRTAQLADGEHTFAGFTLAKDVGLDPLTQVNLPLTANPSELGTAPGTTTDAKHQFMVTAEQIRAALAGHLDTNFICIYFQLHLARTFVWSNAMENQYATNATTASYGGWLYGMPSPDNIFDGYATGGSAEYPGSAAHAYLNMVGEGQKTCQLPIPPFPTGRIDGHKFHDLDNDGEPRETGEPGIEGWRIFIAGKVEGLVFRTSVLTDADGFYEFTGLTAGVWYIAENATRDVPIEDFWNQTYPNIESELVLPVAQPILSSSIPGGFFPLALPGDLGPWGYRVALDENNLIQQKVDFGNVEMGCLQVTKEIDWTGLVGDPADVPDVDFTVVVTGPSHPTGLELIFHLVDGVVTYDDEADATACLCDLVPGDYYVTEPVMPAGWECVAPEVEILYDDPATVLPGVECDVDAINVIVTNPVPQGCLEVTKQIDWTGLIGDPADVPDVDFTVVVTGPSYLGGTDLIFHLVDGVVTYDDEADATACLCHLIPGDYYVTEPSVPEYWELLEILYDDPATVLPCTECGVDAINVTVRNIPIPADVSVEKTGEITYTIVVRNDGLAPALNVDVNDPLPGLLDWQIVGTPSPGTWGITGTGSEQRILTGTIDSLAPAQSVTVTVVAAIDGHSEDPLLGNEVTVTTTSLESDDSNNTDWADIFKIPGL